MEKEIQAEAGCGAGPLMAGSFVRIFTLLWADILVAYALFVMQNYLTNVWKLSSTHSAGILNLWGGLCSILPVFFLFLADVVGNFMMLVLSSIAYSLGIAFIFMSTPPVLANSTGTCKQYESECIGHTQKILLYIGMALVAAGMAGHQICVKPFLNEQKKNPDDNFEIKSIFQLPGFLLIVVVPIVGAIALPYIKPWSIQFGIPAICTIVATILFLSGWCTYQKKPPERSLLSDGRRVFSYTLWMVPMSMTLVVCGIVSSIGNTYFIQQANHLNRRIGIWNVPLQIFLLLFKVSKIIFGLLAGSILSKSRKQVGIALAMIFSVLCCITAARIEIKRRDVIISHGLLDKPGDDIPMSVYWLLFQFFLLGGLDSFLEKSIEAFFDDETSDSMKSYLNYFTKGVSGLGFMCSLLSVHVVGTISERGGRTNWFQSTLNRSRLDKYYWVLAGMSSANLVVFIFVACFYGCMSLI